MLEYEKVTDARAHLKDLLDASEQGRTAVVRRRGQATALVDRQRFVHFLQVLNAHRVRLQPDGDAWLAYVDGAPLAGEGATAEEAVDDLIDALRDYSQDWGDRLRHAPNHEDNWGITQLVDLCGDNELHRWIIGAGPGG